MYGFYCVRIEELVVRSELLGPYTVRKRGSIGGTEKCSLWLVISTK